MNSRRFGTRLAVSIFGVFALATMLPVRGLAQGSPVHAAAAPQSGPLVNIVREATERFKDVAIAEAEGYKPMFGCVSGPDSGAMGIHYVNFPLVIDGVVDPTRPEIVIYEPTANGRLRLIGADFLVLADAWNQTHPHAPEMEGQLFHLFEAPNRFGLPTFYTLHVWAWKNNPTGMFVNWHSDVSCTPYSGPNQ